LRRSVTHARGAIQVEPNGETEVPQYSMKYSRRFDAIRASNPKQRSFAQYAAYISGNMAQN